MKTTKTPTACSPALVLFIVCIVQFLTPFMLSSVGVALPKIGEHFSASAFELSLVEMIYVYGMGLFLVLAGHLGDLYGRKKIFLAGIIVIMLSTLGLALSKSMNLFLLFRFLQGAGGSFVTGTSVAIITAVYPAEKRGKAMGILVACVYTALSLGPTLAGFMITYAGWRFIFVAGLLLSVLALVLTLLKLHDEWAPLKGNRFDLVGSIIYLIALSIIVFSALILKGTESLIGCLVGSLALIGFGLYEKRSSSPSFNVHLLATNKAFTRASIATLLNYASSFGIVFFMSLYLQYVKGYTPQLTGSILIIQPVIQAVLSPYFGKKSDTHSPALLATIGISVCTLGILICSFIGPDSHIAWVLAALVVLGLGFSLFSSPNMTAILQVVQPKDYGTASSMIASMRTFGMLASMTLISVVISHYLGHAEISADTIGQFSQSMTFTLKLFTGLSCIGIALSTSGIQRKGKK